MTTIILFIILIVAILGSFSLVMYFKFKTRLSNGVTFAEMEKYEDEIKRKYYKYVTKFRTSQPDGSYDAVNINALANALQLKVEQASPSTTVRGILVAADSPEYNGIIRFTAPEDNQSSENFDIMHEIVHYLKDVGEGKKVSTSFTRTHHGGPRSHREQVVDYYAAAMAIPRDSLRKQIDACHGNPCSEEFVTKMMNIYRQPRETVRRRINEVIFLS